MEEWLIPWQERGRSGPVHDSFLWRSDSLYVMDNHRLALWCWWQHLDNEHMRWDFIHIDRHYDALWQKARPWLQHYDSTHKSSLDAFRQARFSKHGEEMELYRWDVITSALLTMHRDKIRQWIFVTAEEGAPPAIQQMQFVRPWGLPALLRSMAKSNTENPPAIVDIDLDYFTHFDDDGSIGRVFSSQYLQEINQALIEGMANGGFGVVTIALSPSTTGSWQLAEELCWELLQGIPSVRILQAGVP